MLEDKARSLLTCGTIVPTILILDQSGNSTLPSGTFRLESTLEILAPHVLSEAQIYISVPTGYRIGISLDSTILVRTTSEEIETCQNRALLCVPRWQSSLTQFNV